MEKPFRPFRCARCNTLITNTRDLIAHECKMGDTWE